VGSRSFGGLVVVNLMLNSWDWKTSNNKIYQLEKPVNGVQRWYVVRDLGASLGTTTYPGILKWFRLRGFGQGTRNDLALHFTLGAAVASAVAAFIVIAEEVAGGGHLAAFDVAFAQALRQTVTPGWERFFTTVSLLGTRQVLAGVTLVVATGLLIRGRTVLADRLCWLHRGCPGLVCDDGFQPPVSGLPLRERRDRGAGGRRRLGGDLRVGA
jgi:hypothetical protein